METKRLVSFQLNGKNLTLACDNRQSLLHALRNGAQATGTKEGCMSGDCGACSVIMNGRVVDSCLVLAAEAEGATIETVEGLAEGTKLHPLQEAFLSHAALQCGICTPGFLMASKSLLDKNPNPTDEEIQYALSGNLCRCTGYKKILEAVKEAAKKMQETSS